MLRQTIIGLAMAASAFPALAQTPVRPLLIQGEIKPRSALEAQRQGDIGVFSVGIETLERGYATYDYVAPYVGPLGAGKARLMSGWAQIERKPGRFDFKALDHVVDDVRRQGLQPWVTLNYGNPALYGAAAGGAQVEGKLPGEGAVRDAWLRFVDKTVRHYTPHGRVVEWEIWNEPNASDSGETYGKFAAETAKVILRANPKAVLNIGAFSGSIKPEWAKAALDIFARDSGAPPSQVKVTYHPYVENPDTAYGESFQRLRTMIEAHGYRMRQGENGAPSLQQNNFALSHMDWTEEGQAKYALRRLVADYARGIETGIFTLVETHYPPGVGYPKGKGFWTKNSKGLLQTGPYTGVAPGYGDHRIRRAKLGYGAVQNLFAIFDGRVTPAPEFGCTAPAGYSVYGFTRRDADRTRRLLAIWRSDTRPGLAAQSVVVTISCSAAPLGQPSPDGVTDLQATNPLTSAVYQVVPAAKAATRDGEAFTVTLPVSDTPLLVHDAGFTPVG